MSKSNAEIPCVRLTIGSIEGNVGEYLSLEFLRTVNDVFDEMLSRLYHGAKKRSGWAAKEPWQELTEAECRACVRDALVKGNLIDAMNYVMFTYLNGFSLTTLRQPTVDEPVSVDSQMRDQLATALGIAGRTWGEMLDTVSKQAKIAGKAESINETLKTAYAKEKLIEKIASELKLDPEASEESILSSIHMMVTTRQAELKSQDFGFVRPDGTMIYGYQGGSLMFNGTPLGDSSPGERVIAGPRNIRLSIELTEEQQKQIAETIKSTRIQVNNAIAQWPRMTPPEGVEPARKTILPSAFAAPYGVRASKTQKTIDLTMDAEGSGIPSALFRFRTGKDRDDYLPLLRTFLGALEQAAYGKGRVRHANDLPFIEQPILTMAHMLNSDAGLAQQVIKRTIEARTLPTKAARISELRGTLVYAAAMILFEEMHGKQDDPDELDGDF